MPLEAFCWKQNFFFKSFFVTVSRLWRALHKRSFLWWLLVYCRCINRWTSPSSFSQDAGIRSSYPLGNCQATQQCYGEHFLQLNSSVLSFKQVSCKKRSSFPTKIAWCWWTKGIISPFRLPNLIHGVVLRSSDHIIYWTDKFNIFFLCWQGGYCLERVSMT